MRSDNGLSPDRRQAIFWTNAWVLSIEPWGTNLSEIRIEIQNFIHENAFEDVVWEMASILSGWVELIVVISQQHELLIENISMVFNK